jgi:hypothetical protein
MIKPTKLRLMLAVNVMITIIDNGSQRAIRLPFLPADNIIPTSGGHFAAETLGTKSPRQLLPEGDSAAETQHRFRTSA